MPEGIKAEVQARIHEAGEREAAANRSKLVEARAQGAEAYEAALRLPLTSESVVAEWTEQQVLTVARIDDWTEWDSYLAERAAECAWHEARARAALKDLHAAEVSFWYGVDLKKGLIRWPTKEIFDKADESRNQALQKEIDSAVVATVTSAKAAVETESATLRKGLGQIWQTVCRVLKGKKTPPFGPALMEAYEEVRRRRDEEGESIADACALVWEAMQWARGNWTQRRFEDAFGIWNRLVRGGKGPDAEAFFSALSTSDKARNLRRQKE